MVHYNTIAIVYVQLLAYAHVCVYRSTDRKRGQRGRTRRDSRIAMMVDVTIIVGVGVGVGARGCGGGRDDRMCGAVV